MAGYGKARGEYVVGCHSFSRDEGEEGYFLISAHILLVHGHIMPLTTRLLALRQAVPVSPLLRAVLRALLEQLAQDLPDLEGADRMAVYEQRDRIYLAALSRREQFYKTAAEVLEQHCRDHDQDPREALQALQIDAALCPREGGEVTLQEQFGFDAVGLHRALASMELPPPAPLGDRPCLLDIFHPGGVGDILLGADGGSWLSGSIVNPAPTAGEPATEIVSEAVDLALA